MRDQLDGRGNRAGASLALLPRFHQTMLAAWAIAAVAHAAAVPGIATRQRVGSPGFGTVLAAIFMSGIGIILVWGLVDRVLDRLVYWRLLDVVWQRVIAATVVTPLVAVPSGLSIVAIGYQVVAVASGAVVFVPWAALLVWALGPRRAGRLSVRE